MNCKACNYSLWNLPGRACPECGLAYRPSEFAFTRGSVAFKCPHCAQGYAGTSRQGHLEPTAFHCLKCGHELAMDQMILVPAAGVAEAMTTPQSNPWERGQLLGMGPFGRWYRTARMALNSPGKLGRALWQDSGSARRAANFAMWTWMAVFALSALVFAIFTIPVSLISARSLQFHVLLKRVLSPTLASLLPMLTAAVLVAVAAHIVLLVTGSLPIRRELRRSHFAAAGRTLSVFAYASVPALALIVPFLGWPIFFISLLVIAGMMLQTAHRVSGLRAAASVLAPITLVTLVVATFTIGLPMLEAYRATFVAPAQTANSNQMMIARERTAFIVNSLDTMRLSNADNPAAEGDGAQPLHPAKLFAPGTFVINPADANGAPIGLATDNTNAPAASPSPANPSSIQNPTLDQSELIAFRIGDFVFTYPPISVAPKSKPVPQGVWVVVFCPNPDRLIDPELAGAVIVGIADSGRIATHTFPIDRWPLVLAAQNRVRAQHGLAPLPDITLLRESEPARAGPTPPPVPAHPLAPAP